MSWEKYSYNKPRAEPVSSPTKRPNLSGQYSRNLNNSLTHENGLVLRKSSSKKNFSLLNQGFRSTVHKHADPMVHDVFEDRIANSPYNNFRSRKFRGKKYEPKTKTPEKTRKRKEALAKKIRDEQKHTETVPEEEEAVAPADNTASTDETTESTKTPTDDEKNNNAEQGANAEAQSEA